MQYKIRPSYYTLHTYYFAEAHIRNRGERQAMSISPMRDTIDAGIHPTNHTDFVVAPLDQMFMLWSAVNRISRAGDEIGLDQRVTPLEGLKAMTIWVAEQYNEQDAKGSLEVGKLADLVILSDNPLTVAPLDIKDIQVIETIKEGQTIYQRESPAATDTMQGAWLLTSFGTQPVAEGVEAPSLTIAPDGVVAGFTGVNRLNGRIANEGDKLFGPLATTRRAGPPAAMQVESEFLSALATAAAFHRGADSLELHAADGSVLLVFEGDHR